MDIFVHGVPYDTTENELRELFQNFGTVKRVHLARDRETGRSRGFAFIGMQDDDEALNAIEAIDGCDYGGRRIYVKVSEPREPAQRRA